MPALPGARRRLPRGLGRSRRSGPSSTPCCADYAGRPSPLTECRRLGDELGCRLLLKREDLNHTGSHKINNVLGQALLAKRMGKTRLVAETGAGQHGVATATAAALMGMECIVYMGEVDMARQELNVFRMRLLGRRRRPGGVRAVAPSRTRSTRRCATGSRRSSTSHYCLGLGDGAAPVPVDGAGVPPGDRRRGPGAVPSVLGSDGRLPDVVVACVGGGSNADRHLLRASPRTARSNWSVSSPPVARRSATACPASCTG